MLTGNNYESKLFDPRSLKLNLKYHVPLLLVRPIFQGFPGPRQFPEEILEKNKHVLK